MLTERFNKQRKSELDTIFSKKNISNVWRNIVKDQLRRIDLQDIFDYYDFNYNIDERALLLRNDLLNGNYQCSLPMIFRIEKKFGICRHIVIPQPIDALVLQVITETIRPEILKKQPSSNAFYSQDRHNVSKPHEIDEYGYSWMELWKKMQKTIYKFNEEKELLVVSDLSNFYDSIEVYELRKKIMSAIDEKEVLIDILFKIIEKISWLPDYLPYIGRGLPTTNIEGVRLLGHCFLFELDSYLKEQTNNSFTRWMDDVVFGINSKEEGIEILSFTSDILKSRGLAWNTSKTDIYTSQKAQIHFLIDENKYLDSIDISVGGEAVAKSVKDKFEYHLENNSTSKYYEKVTKRYITIFSKLKSDILLNDIVSLYENTPGIRQNLLYYLSNLGYGDKTSNIVIEILNKTKIYDDISLFNICKLITNWNIPTSNKGYDFIKEIIELVTSFSIKRKTPFDFYCILWVRAKYNHPQELYDFIIKYENIWKSEPFLRRMVTSIMARIYPGKEGKVQTFLESQIATGESSIVSVANCILKFAKLTKIETKINMYLFPNKLATYSLQRFLVLCSVLNADVYRTNEDIANNIKTKIIDDHLRKWIDLQYDIK